MRIDVLVKCNCIPSTITGACGRELQGLDVHPRSLCPTGGVDSETVNDIPVSSNDWLYVRMRSFLPFPTPELQSYLK